MGAPVKAKEVLAPAEALNPSPGAAPAAPGTPNEPAVFVRFVKLFAPKETVEFKDGSAFSFGKSELITSDAKLIEKLRDKDVQRKYEIVEDQ